ncbi:hypothetical protein FOA43_003935 [Brettanomyces nanus]|uniref:Conserved oligomeric Golgi complex subunit 5 n=1 Tax=Eeniella nana TaxID=13502 RepID=A0A875S5G2_EENNA|nr:uncharacterized protein FOA43_003935 [Brettanomyces nanus]QPG76546.1 hypothetical protein FOA43_003935 [Brettanomyces nanus]
MSDLSDYEAYLEDDFEPANFANGLVLSTNNPDDDSIDLLTSLKRLKFDLKDIDKRIKRSVDANCSDLLSEFENVERFSATVSELDPAWKQLNSSYSRLDTEILEPYNECNRIHSALRRIHQTSTLLRSSVYFLYLIGKIEEIDKSDQAMNRKPFKNLLLLAKLLDQVRAHLADSSYLKSLKLVRDFEQFQPSLITHCVDLCAANFKQFNVDQCDSPSILNIVNALLYLSEGTFYNQLQQLLSTKVNQSVTSITRSLNNLKSFHRVFEEVSKNAKLFATLDKLMNENPFIDPAGDRKIWDEVKVKLDMNTSLVTGFWRDVATGIEPRFRAIILKGGPISRNLKSSQDDIKSLIKQSVLSSLQDGQVGECIEVTLMLNSVHSLDLQA